MSRGMKMLKRFASEPGGVDVGVGAVVVVGVSDAAGANAGTEPEDAAGSGVAWTDRCAVRRSWSDKWHPTTRPWSAWPSTGWPSSRSEPRQASLDIARLSIISRHSQILDISRRERREEWLAHHPSAKPIHSPDHCPDHCPDLLSPDHCPYLDSP